MSATRIEKSANVVAILDQPQLAVRKSGVFKTDATATVNIAIGTAVAIETASGLFVPYNGAGSGGAEIAVGFVNREITAAELVAGTPSAPIIVAGVLLTDQLTGVDAGALTDLGARQVLDVTIF